MQRANLFGDRRPDPPDELGTPRRAETDRLREHRGRSEPGDAVQRLGAGPEGCQAEAFDGGSVLVQQGDLLPGVQPGDQVLDPLGRRPGGIPERHRFSVTVSEIASASASAGVGTGIGGGAHRRVVLRSGPGGWSGERGPMRTSNRFDIPIGRGTVSRRERRRVTTGEAGSGHTQTRSPPPHQGTDPRGRRGRSPGRPAAAR